MKNLNKQQTESTKAPDSKLNIQNLPLPTPHSKLKTPQSPLAQGCLHSFTHSALKAEKEAKIKEINPKISAEILTGRDAMHCVPTPTEINPKINAEILTGRDAMHCVPTPADDEAKNVHDDLWESNHALITKAIHELMRNQGRVPTKKELAIKTGLSRPTIHKHLHGFAMHPLFVESEEQFQILSSNVMAKVYEFAMLGDPRAARLYFEITGKLNRN